MCGRYHVETEEENLEVRRLIREITAAHPGVGVATGTIVPSLTAPVLTQAAPAPMRFGIRLPRMPRLIINARAEGAAESRLFSGLLAASRCLVPASAFYEWSADRTAHAFAGPGGLLYMAALFLPAEELSAFAIVTREARGDPARVHPRMPLILDSPELREAWLRSPSLARELLRLEEVPRLREIPLPA